MPVRDERGARGRLRDDRHPASSAVAAFSGREAPGGEVERIDVDRNAHTRQIEVLAEAGERRCGRAERHRRRRGHAAVAELGCEVGVGSERADRVVDVELHARHGGVAAVRDREADRGSSRLAWIARDIARSISPRCTNVIARSAGPPRFTREREGRAAEVDPSSVDVVAMDLLRGRD